MKFFGLHDNILFSRGACAMKKYLPVLIFVLVFTAVLAGQAAYQIFSAPAQAKDDNYPLYEKIFMAGKFQTLDGKNIEVSKLKTKVVIYNFWASWCNPCMEEIPSMIEMKKKFSDDKVLVYAFNTDVENQIQNITKAIKKLNFKNEFHIVADKNTQIADAFKLSAIPVTIIFKQGKVVYFSNGPMDFNSEEMIGNFKKWTAD
jgi:thiol-disulfide isomerase/thioredoxin